MTSPAPAHRLQVRGPDAPPPRPRFVLYWMIAQRRLVRNLALDHAVHHAVRAGLPLLILEPLRCGYRHASDRLHRFVIQGMADNARRAAGAGVRYLSYVEPERDAGKGLLAALSAHAALVVTDGHPGFHYPAMRKAAAAQVRAPLHVVDGNGLLPLSGTEKAPVTAYVFRRHLQRALRDHLDEMPSADPLRAASRQGPAVVPRTVMDTWPFVRDTDLADPTALIARLPIDHDVPPAAMTGGTDTALSRLDAFLQRDLSGYAERRRDPLEEGTSGLSPWLHFGHVGAHGIFERVVRQTGWDPDRLGNGAKGARAGWWGLPAGAEAFLDQLITWRELGFHWAHHRRDHDRYASLPDWARRTLEQHADDERPWRYGERGFEEAHTHDEIWNAAQRQLRREGRMHNYLRMLWGKKILEWSRSPQVAARTMVRLNDRYAVDGRDPNSYSGIFWVLGRHDRPWAPERPVFGVVRFMSSESTRRKLRLGGYLSRYGPDGPQPELFPGS